MSEKQYIAKKYIRKGCLLMIDNRPYIVVELSTYHTHSHGGGILGRDIFTNKKREIICINENIQYELANIEIATYQLVDIDNDKYILMDNTGTITTTRYINDNIVYKIKQLFEEKDIIVSTLEWNDVNHNIKYIKIDKIIT